MEALYHATRQFKPTKKKSLPEKRNQLLRTEVLSLNDTRYKIPKAEQAEEREISSLVRRGTRQIVPKDEVPGSINIICKRFAMKIKDKETENPLYRARYVMQGHRERKKKNLVHEETTVNQISIRIFSA